MRLTQQQLEASLLGAANILRGRTAGQDYKNYILSLLFYKRLCDQWMHEADENIARLEREQGRRFTEAQKAILRAREDIHRFKIPEGCHWADLKETADNIGQRLTKAMLDIAAANDELRGVFTVDWNQPAPDGKGKKLIANEVVQALVSHFNDLDLSNKSVAPDVLGRAYEYLIKYFADDAGAKAGEFFTPPEVVDILIRILEPRPGDVVYDPTCGSGGMLVHSADYLAEKGRDAREIRYRGQEMNWSTYAIARINTILHGLDADIRGGASTITDPQFLRPDGSVEKFSLVIANFPFSDQYWWLDQGQQAPENAKKLKKSVFGGKEGYKDRFGRFTFGVPPASYGDYAFIQHIVASLDGGGRAGVVCPQGVLFRGQPGTEEDEPEADGETTEGDGPEEDSAPAGNGKAKARRRKANPEHAIRKGLLEARLVDAVIALPLNVFYGAGVPACLLILRKERPPERRDRVLLVYAARHFRELANKNQLRPQDVMRILVHYQAYGDPAEASRLAAEHADRLRLVIDRDEAEEVGLLMVSYQPHADRLAVLEAQIAEGRRMLSALRTKGEIGKQQKAIEKLEKEATKPAAKVAERDIKIAEARRRADEERRAVVAVREELAVLYTDPAELTKHARVVNLAEIAENEWNLNVPRYVDTFEPEEPIDVAEALTALDAAEAARREADRELRALLRGVGYVVS